jgi:hypothetical protein
MNIVIYVRYIKPNNMEQEKNDNEDTCKYCGEPKTKNIESLGGHVSLGG